ncbi:hypothetical protein FACS189491_06270 [Spirochaetia bacterium]|nr:hypothetical protein FACS189491_06270 [Spirochaetia bacterium]
MILDKKAELTFPRCNKESQAKLLPFSAPDSCSSNYSIIISILYRNYNIFKQASIPPATTAVKIAGALGVSVEYLVSGQKPRNGGTAASPGAKIHSILQILKKLDEKDQDIMFGIAQV